MRRVGETVPTDVACAMDFRAGNALMLLYHQVSSVVSKLENYQAPTSSDAAEKRAYQELDSAVGRAATFLSKAMGELKSGAVKYEQALNNR